MAKHFSWCLKRTFIFMNRLNAYKQSVPALKTTDYAIQCRYIGTPHANRINVDYDEPQDFDGYSIDARRGSTIAVETLIKLLSVARENAINAIKEYPNFKLLTKKIILNNFQLLREKGFYKSTIKDNKYLLTDNTEILRKKIDIIKKLDVDINDAASLFNLSVQKIATFERRSRMEASYWPSRNRIIYLAEKLQCDPATICTILTYNPDLRKIPAPKLLTTTEYLLEIGMDPAHILKDMQVYSYNIVTIKDKIERAKVAGIKPLKPWVIRCTEDLWEKVEERNAERRSILPPDKSIAEYICEIFDCDIEYVKHYMKKDPRVMNMDVTLLNKILLFLRDEGYKIEDISRTPLIVHRKFENMKERFNAWKSVSTRQPSLFIFVQSQKKFDNILAKERSQNEKIQPT